MEIGALDIRERISQQSTSTVVLTEDNDTSLVMSVAESSGFNPSQTVVQSYYGVTSIHNLRPLIAMIRKVKSSAIMVVHRDRDFLTDTEVATWKADVIKLKAEPFVTERLDIESHFIAPDYLASKNKGVSSKQFSDLITKCHAEARDETVANYVNGRTHIARLDKNLGALNPGNLAVEAQKSVSTHSHRFVGKSTLKDLRVKFKAEHNRSLQIGGASPLLKCEDLEQIAKKVKKPAKTAR